MAEQMKGITCCGDCGYYNWKKRKCNRCESIETDPRKHFYDDCPLPDVVEIIRCKDCRHRDPEDRKCDCGGMPFDTQIFPVPDDWFCPYGERKDGEMNVSGSDCSNSEISK